MWLDRYSMMSRALDYARDNLNLTEREREVIQDLCKQARKFHHIFNGFGTHMLDLPWADDDNGGLPEWYFTEHCNFDNKNDWVSILVDLEKDTVEWIPACGPAPCWEAKYSTFANTDELWASFLKWNKANY